MARSKKGLLTYNRILQTSKELFYEKGFIDTTVKEICEKADVKLGTFTYYFNTKEALVAQIYAELLMKSYSWVNCIEQRKMNSLEKNVTATFLYYQVIFDDVQNTRFHHEVLTKISIYTYLSNTIRRMYPKFVRDLKLDMDPKELQTVFSADLGIRRELILKFIEKMAFEDSLELSAAIYTMLGRLLKMDGEIMKDYIQRAVEFLEKNDLSRIRFLV